MLLHFHLIIPVSARNELETALVPETTFPSLPPRFAVWLQTRRMLSLLLREIPVEFDSPLFGEKGITALLRVQQDEACKALLPFMVISLSSKYLSSNYFCLKSLWLTMCAIYRQSEFMIARSLALLSFLFHINRNECKQARNNCSLILRSHCGWNVPRHLFDHICFRFELLVIFNQQVCLPDKVWANSMHKLLYKRKKTEDTLQPDWIGRRVVFLMSGVSLRGLIVAEEQILLSSQG